MPRFVPIVLVAALAACGGTSSNPSVPTAATVTVQQSDVPRGMVRCDLSGDIQNFIHKEQSPDPSTSTATAKEWSQAQKNGAVAAQVAIYADTKSHCTEFANGKNDPAAVPYKLVIDFVIQFKDARSATSNYTNDSIFGVTASSLSASGTASIQGSKTGLGPNSVVVSQTVSSQTFFIALWQNKTFDVFLAVLNVDPAAANKIATLENNRIK